MNRAQRNRAARLARRVRVDGRLVAPLPDEKHGTTSAYSNWGCRCLPCTEANTTEWREYYRAATGPYRAHLAKGSQQLRQERRAA